MQDRRHRRTFHPFAVVRMDGRPQQGGAIVNGGSGGRQLSLTREKLFVGNAFSKNHGQHRSKFVDVIYIYFILYP